MACFGCSRRASNKNIEEDLVKTSTLTKKKKKNSFISWPRLWTKKSDAKTVPVDVSMSGSLDPISKSHSVKVDNKDIFSSKKYRLPIGVNAIYSYKVNYYSRFLCSYVVLVEVVWLIICMGGAVDKNLFWTSNYKFFINLVICCCSIVTDNLCCGC